MVRILGIKLSTLEAAAEALLRVNNIRVRYPDETDEEIRKGNEREWTEKNEVVVQQWREFQRVFEKIRRGKNMFPELPHHKYPRPKLSGTWIDVNE